MAHENTDVKVICAISAATGPLALAKIRAKIEALAPGRDWVLRPLDVVPAKAPGPDGEWVGPPWLFKVEVTISVPIPHDEP